ncbi:MAG: OmpA family protein [Desulfobacteraceae bacterium]|nr:MAG: OmpA family protein [Desulfobacteraceae bacterium]
MSKKHFRAAPGISRSKTIFSMMIVLLAAAVALMSCAGATRQQKGAAIGTGVGAGVGAVLGQAIGRNTAGTLIGAGIGALAGGVAGSGIGSYMDRQERELKDAVAATEAAAIRRTNDAVASAELASVQRTNDVLTATFRSEVLFDYDSAALHPGAYTELGRVATVLNRYPDTAITVEGHTDSRGSEAYNQQLSERRAQAVRSALIQRGVDSGRIRALGLGETQPISSNDAINRRVNIVIEPIAKG